MILKKEFQKGLIKEIVVVIAVIFILAYFNLEPKEIWNEIVELYELIINKIK